MSTGCIYVCIHTYVRQLERRGYQYETGWGMEGVGRGFESNWKEKGRETIIC